MSVTPKQRLQSRPKRRKNGDILGAKLIDNAIEIKAGSQTYSEFGTLRVPPPRAGLGRGEYGEFISEIHGGSEIHGEKEINELLFDYPSANCHVVPNLSTCIGCQFAIASRHHTLLTDVIRAALGPLGKIQESIFFPFPFP